MMGILIKNQPHLRYWQRTSRLTIVWVLCFALCCQSVSSFSSVRLSQFPSSKDSPSTIRQAAILSDATNTELETPVHKCGFCDAAFSSRNAMFRHIRASPDCAVAAGETQPFNRQRLAFLFGYHHVEAEDAGNMLLGAFQEAVDSSLNIKMELLRNTQSTIPRSRPSCLGLESDCPAAEDVLIVTFMAPDESCNSTLDIILETTRTSLVNSGVALHACKVLDGKYLHAEQSCTQHIFHYLVPLHWLPDSDDIVAWRKNQCLPAQERKNNIPSPPSLRRIKDALRSAESKKVKEKACDGRFKALAHKEKRPWHNYADPDLVRGVEASPSNEPVWRALDRARFHSFATTPTNGDDDTTYIVYEFCGDEFLKQQVRRVMGTAIAMAHGWLDGDFINETTKREVVVETPLAPAGHLYRACSRFHFEEMALKGNGIFDSEGVHRTTPDPSLWMQEKLIIEIEKKLESESNDVWLTELRETVAPDVSAKLKAITSGSHHDFNEPTDFDVSQLAPSEEYQGVLSLLQDIVETDRWPKTSAARSTVITNVDEAEQTRAGSFTAVNTNCTMENLPLANSVFPELADAVFQLESYLAEHGNLDAVEGGVLLEASSPGKRPPSSHCAINCNAQFVPHVDSGRGAGQSLSMIVGLGDYQGGELLVEGDAHDIRYRPLEFDGWNLRHWTKPFAGQRFSLVWFTPE